MVVEVWDWDRITRNDFIGGFSMTIRDVLESTKEGRMESWYKLLDEKRFKEAFERIIADEEAFKVS